MGLMDKFKNLFTDEEIFEEEDTGEVVEIKEIKKEEKSQLPTFMREKLEQEKEKNIKINNFEIEDEVRIEEVKTEKKDKELPKINQSIYANPELEEKKNFKFPIEFSNDDFVETRTRSREREREYMKPKEFKEIPKEIKKEVVKSPKLEEKKKVAEIYKDKKETKEEEKKKFKATPIISPIYGVLDKNYSPGDVECNVGENFERKRPSKNVDFDSVRKKAYGSLSKEIKENLMCENCEYLKEAKECKKSREKNLEENIVYEAMNAPCDDYYDRYKLDRRVKTKPYKEEPNNSYHEEGLPKNDMIREDYNTTPNYGYQDITLDEATENYYDYGVEYEKGTDYSSVSNYNYEDNNYIRLDDEEDSNTYEEKQIKTIPPVKSSINLLSTLKKSMGEDTTTENKNLELTDDLFNLIDSMYDERND